MQLQGDVIIKIAGVVLSVVGPVVVFSGGLIAYIFNTYRSQNQEEHRNLFKKSDEHGTDIARIKGRLKL